MTVVSKLPGADGSGRRYRIVVADDAPRIREVLVRLLSAEYDMVGIVANGQELIDAARELKPDVAIVDISMPVMSGFEAVGQMKADGVEAKVIFFTGNGNPFYVQKAFSLGATGYVIKEHGFEELPLALRAVLTGGTFVSPSIGAKR